MPTTNFKGIVRMAQRCARAATLARLYEADNDLESRRIIAAVMTEQAAELHRLGFDQFHFYTLNQSDYLRVVPCAGPAAEGGRMSFDRTSRIAWLKEEAKKVLAIRRGVMMQGYKLGEAEFRGDGQSHSELKGDNDLTLTRPDRARDRPCLSRGRRGHPRNQHLHVHRNLPGRLARARPGGEGTAAHGWREICVIW